MKALLTFSFLILSFAGHTQQWDWWMADYANEMDSLQVSASNASGDLAIVLSGDNTRLNHGKKSVLNHKDKIAIFNRKGKLKNVITTHRKIVHLGRGDVNDRLYLIAENFQDSQFRYSLIYTDSLDAKSLIVKDSVLLDSKDSAIHNGFESCIIDSGDYKDISLGTTYKEHHLNQFSTHISQPGLKKDGFNGSGNSITVSGLNYEPQIQQISNFHAHYFFSVKDEFGQTDLWQVDLFPFKPEKFDLDKHIYHTSISSLGTAPYIQVFYRDSLIWKDSVIDVSPKGSAILELDENLNISNIRFLDVKLGIVHFGKDSLMGRTLFDGGQFFSNYLVSTFSEPYKNGSRVGFLRFNSALELVDSSAFFIDKQTHPVQNQMSLGRVIPYASGLYFMLTSLNPKSTSTELRLESDPVLDYTGPAFKNIILHYNYYHVELSKKASCTRTEFKLLPSNSQIDSISWFLNDQYVQSNYTDTITIFHHHYDNPVKLEAHIRMRDGKRINLSDTIYPRVRVYPSLLPFTGTICQWNKVELSQNSRSDTFSIMKPLEHVWEYWKNDTVFVSDTAANPTVHFTNPGVYTLKYYVTNGICKEGIVLKDTITVKPAARAKIQGLPFPICSGGHVELTPKPYTNTLNSFTWYDGTTSTNESKKVIGKEPFQWVKLTTTSSNGCETYDSAYFRVRLSGDKVADSVITGQDLTPTFYLSPSEGFTKFRFQRNDGTSDQILWHKPDHRDASVSLGEMTEGYTIAGIDSCGNKALTEAWHPPLLTYLEDENQLKLRPSGVGQQEYWAKRGNGKWLLLNQSFSQLDIDTLTDVYQFRYREYNPNTRQAAISNTVEVIPQNQFFLPNAFSPNGDGINDVFSGVHPQNVEVESIQVFARNGQVVRHATDIGDIWNGRVKGLDAHVGTYTYIINYQEDGKSKSLSGGVMLVR